MEVPITQFRKQLFDFVNQAIEGREVWVSHKGSRLRLVPERKPSKLSRITPMQILIPEDFDPDDPDFKAERLAEIEKEWQRDWQRKWERRLGPIAKPALAKSVSANVKAGKARRTK